MSFSSFSPFWDKKMPPMGAKWTSVRSFSASPKSHRPCPIWGKYSGSGRLMPGPSRSCAPMDPAANVRLRRLGTAGILSIPFHKSHTVYHMRFSRATVNPWAFRRNPWAFRWNGSFFHGAGRRGGRSAVPPGTAAAFRRRPARQTGSFCRLRSCRPR